MINNDEELKKQVEKLQIELSKSKRDKMALEVMVLERDKGKAFSDKQVQSRDARTTMIELQLGKKGLKGRI
jgi:hypothetical protein